VNEHFAPEAKKPKRTQRKKQGREEPGFKFVSQMPAE
jgi:hypothetical protein